MRTLAANPDKGLASKLDCPQAGPGRPSPDFAGPGPGPRGPGRPLLALALLYEGRSRARSGPTSGNFEDSYQAL